MFDRVLSRLGLSPASPSPVAPAPVRLPATDQLFDSPLTEIESARQMNVSGQGTDCRMAFATPDGYQIQISNTHGLNAHPTCSASVRLPDGSYMATGSVGDYRQTHDALTQAAVMINLHRQGLNGTGEHQYDISRAMGRHFGGQRGNVVPQLIEDAASQAQFQAAREHTAAAALRFDAAAQQVQAAREAHNAELAKLPKAPYVQRNGRRVMDTTRIHPAKLETKPVQLTDLNASAASASATQSTDRSIGR